MSHDTEVQLFKLSPTVFEAAAVHEAIHLRGLQIRSILIDGEPWFAAREVCSALGLSNVSMALGRLDTDERVDHAISSTDTLMEPLVSESGLFSLVLTSRRPQAKAFKRWVTHEVLPAIRKTGSYAVPTQPKSRVELARELLAAEERAEALAKDLDAKTNMLSGAIAAINENKPKVEAYNELMDADGSLSLAQAAQTLRMGRDQLIEKLALWGGIMVRPGHSDHLRPYQEHVRAGRFVVKVRSVDITHRDGSSEVITQGTTRVTAKGLEWCRQKGRVGTLDRAHAQKIRSALTEAAEATA